MRSSRRIDSPTPPAETPPAEDDAAKAARLKQEAQNDRIVNTFNSVSDIGGAELAQLLTHCRISRVRAQTTCAYVQHRERFRGICGFP